MLQRRPPSRLAWIAAVCLLLVCAVKGKAELAFSGARGRAPEIYVIDERVGEVSTRNLTNHFANDTMPDWSPDGRKIAFASDRDNYPGDIFVMGSDGSSQTNLTNHPAWEYQPSWSPDGQRIAFTRSEIADRDGIARVDVFAMNADGGGLRQLTDHPFVDHEPAWSPGGQQIAFTSRRDGAADIYVIPSEGGEITRLTDHPLDDGQAAWSPDGDHIAFVSWREGLAGLYVMKANGKGIRRLTDEPGWNLDPTWDPDGTTIAFSSGRGVEGRYLVMLNIDTGKTTRSTQWADRWGPGRDRHPSWLPTGRGVDIRADHRAVMWGWLKQLGAGGRNQ